MVVGEPVRELVTISFWLKMFLVALGTLVASVFQITLRKHEEHWEEAHKRQAFAYPRRHRQSQPPRNEHTHDRGDEGNLLTWFFAHFNHHSCRYPMRSH